jgi:hypothetical protein
VGLGGISVVILVDVDLSHAFKRGRGELSFMRNHFDIQRFVANRGPSPGCSKEGVVATETQVESG